MAYGSEGCEKKEVKQVRRRLAMERESRIMVVQAK